jgi:serine/threonine protein phosphatase PrpC
MAQITVIEGLSLPGYADRENDDAFGATKAVAFVLDGLTSLADAPVMPGRSDAAWAARTARELLAEHGGSGTDLSSLATTVARGITARFEAERLREARERYEMPWTTMSLIGVEAGRLNIAYLGDSRILVETADDQVHNFGIGPRSHFETKLAAKMIAARKGQAPDPKAVLPELRMARNLVNTPKGAWVLGADVGAVAQLKLASLQLDGPATVLLATDGFYALVEDYGHYGDRELIATAQAIGLTTLGRELRHIEDSDPNGERYPRMKKSDDATALLVRVEP